MPRGHRYPLYYLRRVDTGRLLSIRAKEREEPLIKLIEHNRPDYQVELIRENRDVVHIIMVWDRREGWTSTLVPGEEYPLVTDKDWKR